MNIRLKKYLILLVVLVVALLACDDDWKNSIADQPLAFSIDTLSFDTVFTTIGSATSKVMVYNKSNKPLVISEVRLSGKSSSAFKINVDGMKDPNHSFNDISLRAGDSIFIFVEVKIDPNNTDAPVLIQDSIIFDVQNQKQSIILAAIGRDVEILRGVVFQEDTVLQSEKPYLVYDSLVVDPDVTLIINEGTSFYFHNNTGLFVFGNLKINGTFEKPVLMRGDRLDKAMAADPIPYNFLPGQWSGVYLLSETGHHEINHLHTNSGVMGVYFRNDDRSFKPYLEINNSRIHNSQMYGLIAINGDLRVTNSEISNSGSYTVYLNGGSHKFYHCTIANYFSKNDVNWLISTGRDSAPAVMLMDLNKALPMETVFKNCVISGTSANEFTLASKFRYKFKADIQNSYIKRDEPDSLDVFKNIRWYEHEPEDTIFVSDENDIKEGIYFDFSLDSVSPARGLADPDIAAQFPLDLSGRSRLVDGEPDAGAYEWYPSPSEEE